MLTIDEAVELAAKNAADAIEEIAATGWYFGTWDQYFEVAMQRVIRTELATLRALFSHLTKEGISGYYTRIIEQAIEYLQHPMVTLAPKPEMPKSLLEELSHFRLRQSNEMDRWMLAKTIKEIKSHYTTEGDTQ